MKKRIFPTTRRSLWRSWPRLLLWTHVMSVIGFYVLAWLRVTPRKGDHLLPLPTQPSTSTCPIQKPIVSIIVPARNEEKNIRRCVRSLLEQDYTHYEVIVVDDDSTDATARILHELATTHPARQRLRVLHLHDLPPGWTGKPHALYKGVQAAQGEWLLFTDADTWHAPGALHSALNRALQEKADLLTLLPTQELPTFWEKVMMPAAYMGIGFQYPPAAVNNPASPVAVANGPYILLRRAVYDQLGGYGRPDLRNTLLDDRDLALLIKQGGFRLRLLDGRDLVSIRMYEGLFDAWRGWRKNIVLGSRGGLGLALFVLLFLPLISIVPFLLPFLSVLSARGWMHGISKAELRLGATLELVPLLLSQVRLNGYLQIPWYYALTHPLAGALFVGILGESTWRVMTGQGLDWRGRLYYTHPEPPPETQPTLPSKSA